MRKTVSKIPPKRRASMAAETAVVREDSQMDFAAAQKPQATNRVRTPKSDGAFQPLVFRRDEAALYLGNVRDLYAHWTPPTVIVSDGAYGLASFPGDPPTVAGLEEWYRPHIETWSRCALPETTLWFWNSELGWATVHPLLIAAGWEFRNCNIWDKGIAHIAGNANTKTLRKFPVVTEVCVQYVKRTYFEHGGVRMTMQDWLRYEWIRAGLPLWKTNDACGVKNAATRKYFTADHLWYFPPPDAFDALARYANFHGKPAGRPYFSRDGKRPITGGEWARLRAKFKCDTGITNVWNEPAVRGIERMKENNQCIHMNQKPLKLLEMVLNASSEVGDVVWEPFGGLCSASIAAHKLRRRSFAAECVTDFFNIAVKRLDSYDVF
jgi:site-specific DNA-methyltransferase (adenine-specific)